MPLSWPTRSRHCHKTSNVDAPQILWLVLRRRRRTAMTPAMAAWTHARAEGPWHHRATGPTGAHPWWKRSTREDVHPFGTFGTARTIHAVVRAERMIMPRDRGAGEEDDRHDENRAGDNHHPRRSLVEPRMFQCVGRRRRWPGRRLELGLGCLGHPSIMPTRAPAI